MVLDGRPHRGLGVGLAALTHDLSGTGSRDDWAGSPTDMARAARLRQRRSTRLMRAGRFTEAAEDAAGVVRIYRRLALGEQRYRDELALALTARGFCAARAGCPEQAETALLDAVRLYRTLLAGRGRLRAPRALRGIRLRVGLATALSNLGLAHADLGEPARAVRAGEEAVRVLRRLRARSPLYRLLALRDRAGSAHSLASALSNLGVLLTAQGDRRRAWELADEATRILRRLTASDPATFGPELGVALHNLGLVAAELGRHRDAMAATEEAVRLHRGLARRGPAHDDAHLGRSLCSFAVVRTACRLQLDEALAAAREAVVIHERLAERQPQIFSADLCDAYQAVSRVRAALGAGG